MNIWIRLYFQIQILENEIRQFILIISPCYIKKHITFHRNIPHHHMTGIRIRYVLTPLQVKKLLPRLCKQKAGYRTRYILYRNIFIILRRIRTHFQPQQPFCIIQVTATENNIIDYVLTHFRKSMHYGKARKYNLL